MTDDIERGARLESKLIAAIHALLNSGLYVAADVRDIVDETLENDERTT